MWHGTQVPNISVEHSVQRDSFLSQYKAQSWVLARCMSRLISFVFAKWSREEREASEIYKMKNYLPIVGFELTTLLVRRV